MDNNLSELVERYGNMKAEMDSYKKQVEADNKEIKSIMIKSGMETCSAGGYTAKCSKIESADFDEQKLLDVLKAMNFKDCIKTKEYVDMDSLENAIYTGKLNAAELASCKETKVQYRLTISKDK